MILLCLVPIVPSGVEICYIPLLIKYIFLKKGGFQFNPFLLDGDVIDVILGNINADTVQFSFHGLDKRTMTDLYKEAVHIGLDNVSDNIWSCSEDGITTGGLAAFYTNGIEPASG